jgi:hypothetical protein
MTGTVRSFILKLAHPTGVERMTFGGQTPPFAAGAQLLVLVWEERKYLIFQ